MKKYFSVLLLLIVQFSCLGEKREFIANYHSGENHFILHEGKIMSNRLIPSINTSMYLIKDNGSIYSKTPTSMGTLEVTFKIVSEDSEGILGEDILKDKIRIIQINPSLKEVKWIVIENNGYVTIERYEMTEVPDSKIKV